MIKLDPNKIKLGIAPIGWTNDDMPELGKEQTFEQIISEMALAGFNGCEVGSKYPRHDLDLLKYHLKMRNMQIVNCWFSTFFADGKKDETIKEFIKHRDFLHEMGAKVIGASEQSGSIQGIHKPVLGEKRVFTDKEWKLVGEGYKELASLAAEKGMKASIHPHMGTGVQFEDEIDRFVDESGENVYLTLDTGHVFYAEGCSQEKLEKVFSKHVKSIAHIHLKDVRPTVVERVKKENASFLAGVRMGTFTVPGDGAINFEPIFKIIDDGGFEGWMIIEAEQDPAIANPFEYALKGRKYLKELTGL